jgi:hypothetical protein
VQSVLDRRIDLLQLGQQFGRQSQIAVAERDLFVLAAQLLIDRLEPDQLALLRCGEALVTVPLGDQSLDRSRKRDALTRLVERSARDSIPTILGRRGAAADPCGASSAAPTRAVPLSAAAICEA